MTDQQKLSFPCKAPVKLFGPNDPQFLEEAKKMLFALIEGFTEEALSFKESKEGRYLSITVDVLFVSQDHYDTFHQKVLTIPRIVYVL